MYLYSKPSLKINRNEALGVLGGLVGAFRTLLCRQGWPESTQEEIREGQMLPESAHGALKGGPKVPKRSPRGAQEVPRRCPRGPKNDQIVPTSFQKCVREASLEVARNIVKNMV